MISKKRQFANDKQTLATFVVGKANEKTVKVVQEWMTDKKKNRKLFICGDSGNGKTHLANAVYKQMLGQGVHVRMRDVDSFTKELIGWLRVGGTVEEYYKNYSELTDVLIIDDIRSFERTPAAAGYCKELVKRFVKEKKKILLTTDSKTAIYRWPGGLFARKIQIKKPDKKLKVDILRKYAATRNFYVPEDILLLVSEIDANMAELTATLHEVLVYNKILGEKLDRKLIERIWEKRMSQKRREKR